MRKKKRLQPCEPLEQYIKRHGITRRELAFRLGFDEDTTKSLVNGYRPVTAKRAVTIEEKIGIPRETLRPDLFVKRAA